MKYRTWFISGTLCAALFTGCGPSTFLISKAGTSANFGRDRPFLRMMLCERGELSLVLANAGLSQELKDAFYRYVCSDERSYDKVVSLYLFLTPAERSRLKKSFRQQGYDVNSLPC